MARLYHILYLIRNPFCFTGFYAFFGSIILFHILVVINVYAHVSINHKDFVQVKCIESNTSDQD